MTERASRDTETRRRDLLAGVARIAYRELVAWLGADFGYDPLAAYQLMTQVGGLYVVNTVNTTYSLVASCPTRYLSASS